MSCRRQLSTVLLIILCLRQMLSVVICRKLGIISVSTKIVVSLVVFAMRGGYNVNTPLGLDSVDLLIIDCVAQNGRLPFVDIARQANVSEATVRNRVARLTSTGILTFVGVVDPFRTGLYSVALVGIQVDETHVHDLCLRLSEFPEIRFVVACAGTFNIMVEVITPSTDSLSSFISSTLAQIPEIHQMSVSHELKLYKNAFKFTKGANL